MSGYAKPRTYDYNIVVIGGGSAGLVAAYIAAAVKARVALIEAHTMGGECLTTGCIPSKALIRSAKILSYARRAQEFGFRSAEVEFDFADVMARVRRVIKPSRLTTQHRGIPAWVSSVFTGCAYSHPL